MANSLRMEMETKGISVTQIHFPLVHTAMSGATKSFRKLGFQHDTRTSR